MTVTAQILPEHWPPLPQTGITLPQTRSFLSTPVSWDTIDPPTMPPDSVRGRLGLVPTPTTTVNSVPALASVLLP